MAEVITLADRRDAHRSRTVRRGELLFDLACPFTYLVAERVERAFERITWTPASAPVPALHGDDPDATARLRAAAARRAAELRLPLVWPERHPGDARAAMRVAAYAAEQGRGGAFVLAAGRLAFCGGFDLQEPEILAEAAAAAGLPLGASLRAARDAGRDGPIEDAGRRLLAAGADRLPALQVGRALYWGEGRIAEAIAAVRRRRPVARERARG
jgi:2-hydroxychromene-2-carboxylate isomerase